MKYLTLVTLAATALVLAACGESEDSDSASSDSTSTTTASSDAPASCPPTLTMAPRAEGAPVDDVVGLRPGMSYDDVVGILKCREGNFEVETVATPWLQMQTWGIPLRQMVRATDGLDCDNQEIIRNMSMGGVCNDGGGFFKSRKNVTDEIFVTFTGMQGQEVARSIWRSRYFTDADRPTVQSLKDSLVQKYGDVHAVTESATTYYSFWAWDLANQKVAQSGPPSDPSRAQIISCSSLARFLDGLAIFDYCGTSIAVEITHSSSNELLAQEFHIGMTHQKNTLDAIDAFEAALNAENERRKKDEADKAGSSKAGSDL